jgi:hypothetical protein
MAALRTYTDAPQDCFRSFSARLLAQSWTWDNLWPSPVSSLLPRRRQILGFRIF